MDACKRIFKCFPGFAEKEQKNHEITSDESSSLLFIDDENVKAKFTTPVSPPSPRYRINLQDVQDHSEEEKEEDTSIWFRKDAATWLQENKCYIIAGTVSVSIISIIVLTASLGYFSDRSISPEDEKFIQMCTRIFNNTPIDLYMRMIQECTSDKRYEQLGYLAKVRVDSMFSGVELGYMGWRSWGCQSCP
jgi:hypothetical protein